MKKINIPLILGLVILVCIGAAYYFPDQLTDKDPLAKFQYRTYFVKENGEEVRKSEAAPLSPNATNIFGSNQAGLDIYTRLIYGTKTTIDTITMTVVMRFVLALLVGVAAGVGLKAAEAMVKVFHTAFTAIPTLIFCFLVLSINYFRTLPVEQSVIATAIIFTIVGWGKLAYQIQAETKKILDEDFIEGEIAIGKSKWKLLLQNVVPHLTPSLVVLVFLEAGLVLFLMTQLAVLSIFVGPTVTLRNYDGSIVRQYAQEAAWNNELSFGIHQLSYMQKYYYWLVFYPAVTMFLGILGFNLTGEGLRIEIEKKNSRIVTLLKRLAFLLSPNVYLQQVKRYREYPKSVLIKTVCVVLSGILVFAPQNSLANSFDIEKSKACLAEISKPEYEGRITGYEGGYQAGEYIVAKLKEYGLQPYDGENYTQEFPVVPGKTVFFADRFASIWDRDMVYMRDGEMILESEEGERLAYKLGEDFVFTAIQKDLIGEQHPDFIEFKRKAILLRDISSMEKEEIQSSIMMTPLNKGTDPREFYEIVNNRNLTEYGNSDVNFYLLDENRMKMECRVSPDTTNILVFGELKEKLISGKYTVSLRFSKPKLPVHNGRNILAVLPGTTWEQPDSSSQKKRLIIIGAKYDSRGSNGLPKEGSAANAAGAAVNLEIARVLSQMNTKREENILLAFWDGEMSPYSGSEYYCKYNDRFISNYYDIIYFDIGDISDDSIKNIAVNIENYQFLKLDNAYAIIEAIKKTLADHKISHTYVSDMGKNGAFGNLFNHAHIRVHFGAPNYGFQFTDQDRAENISGDKMKTIGNLILDMITNQDLFGKGR